jgi:hypothetical protein
MSYFGHAVVMQCVMLCVICLGLCGFFEIPRVHEFKNTQVIKLLLPSAQAEIKLTSRAHTARLGRTGLEKCWSYFDRILGDERRLDEHDGHDGPAKIRVK